ncbi:MAG: Ribonuclease D [Turneriella sp.]|nr:Ribonuclease D [Turneriella sp.]
MAFKIITIPFDKKSRCFFEDVLNEFCLNKIVLTKKIRFFQDQNGAYWTVFLEYSEVLQKTNAAEALPEADQLLFERLREWRKGKADEKGFPVYVVCNNAQLREIALDKPTTFEGLKKIKGFGQKKVEDYGDEVLKITRAFCQNTSEAKTDD